MHFHSGLRTMDDFFNSEHYRATVNKDSWNTWFFTVMESMDCSLFDVKSNFPGWNWKELPFFYKACRLCLDTQRCMNSTDGGYFYKDVKSDQILVNYVGEEGEEGDPSKYILRMGDLGNICAFDSKCHLGFFDDPRTWYYDDEKEQYFTYSNLEEKIHELNLKEAIKPSLVWQMATFMCELLCHATKHQNYHHWPEKHLYMLSPSEWWDQHLTRSDVEYHLEKVVEMVRDSALPKIIQIWIIQALSLDPALRPSFDQLATLLYYYMGEH
jgi:hypothetical protein